jgi:hypothetical protein
MALTPAPVAVRKQIVDLSAHVPATPLVFMSGDAEVLNYALAMAQFSSGTVWARPGTSKTGWLKNMLRCKSWLMSGMRPRFSNGLAIMITRSKPGVRRGREFHVSNHVTLISDNVGRVPRKQCSWKNSLAWRVNAWFAGVGA